jgi:hypothetical protein
MSTVKTDAIETAAGGTSVLTIGSATQTIKLPGGTPGASKVLTSDATGGATWAAAAAGGTNTPAFLAYLSTSVAITDAVSVKALCNTQLLDTDNLYDNTVDYRFTVDAASVGWYWISGTCECYFGTAEAAYLRVMIFRNGVEYVSRYNNMNSNPATTYGITSDGIIDLTTVGDYVELWVRADDTSGSPQLNGKDATTYYQTYFNGYKLSGVT